MLQSPFFFCFLPSHPLQPQARQASPSISTSPTGQWTRWCPTCLGEPRRTEVSWKVPKGRGSCCGRSWNADLPLGRFSTDRCTENTEEETKRRACQRVFIFYFFYLSCLTAAAVAVCSVSASVKLSLDVHLLFFPVLEFSCWWTVSTCHSLFLSSHCCYSSVLFLTDVTHLHPHPFFCVLPMFSLFLFLICLCIHKHPSFCLPVVYKALVSIKWASLLLQKDSLKCQRDQGGHLFLSPYLSWRGTTIIKITGLI